MPPEVELVAPLVVCVPVVPSVVVAPAVVFDVPSLEEALLESSGASSEEPPLQPTVEATSIQRTVG